MSINNTLQPTSAHADSDGYRRYHIVPTGRVFKILIILMSNLSPKYPPN